MFKTKNVPNLPTVLGANSGFYLSLSFVLTDSVSNNELVAHR